MNPIVLIHGYSSEGRTDQVDPRNDAATIPGLYGELPEALRALFPENPVVQINLARYISLEDGISIEDISFALDRAFRDPVNALFDGHAIRDFNVIIHSTGALVIRNWIRRYAAARSEARRVIYLAGANFGSGIAHLGKADLAKWFREYNGTERGMKVLTALELGSDWTVEMHREVEKRKADPEFGVREHVIMGSAWDKNLAWLPVRYPREDGSDGVVRVSTANLNFNYIRIEANGRGKSLSYDDVKARQTAYVQTMGGESPTEFDDYDVSEAWFAGPNGRVAFAKVFEFTHERVRGLHAVTDAEYQSQVIPLIQAAFTNDDEQAVINQFADRTAQTTAASINLDTDERVKLIFHVNHRKMYDGHAHLIVRVKDQWGQPVPGASIFFNAFGGDTTNEIGTNPEIPVGDLIEDVHKNQCTPGILSYFFRIEEWKDGVRHNRLTDLHGITVEIDGVEPETSLILYLPCRYNIQSADLPRFIQVDRTTILDVVLYRVGHPGVTQLVAVP